MFDDFSMASRHDVDQVFTSLEKKRARDRRAQKALRLKKDNRIKVLEEKAAYCEQNHCHSNVQDLAQRCQNLEWEIKILRERQVSLRSLV